MTVGWQNWKVRCLIFEVKERFKENKKFIILLKDFELIEANFRMSELKKSQGISFSLPTSFLQVEEQNEKEQEIKKFSDLRKSDNLSARERSWTVVDITSANLLSV